MVTDCVRVSDLWAVADLLEHARTRPSTTRAARATS